jgi:hypothetical protein
MSDLFDRLGNVIKSEWNARFSDDPIEHSGRSAFSDRDTTNAIVPSQAYSSSKRVGRMDVGSAWRVLELAPNSNLQAVRKQYQVLSKRYHPRTLSDNPDHAYSAQTVIDGLTEAVEILEEELIPWSPREGAKL